MIHNAFTGHGTFIYDPIEALARYQNSPAKLADAVVSLHMKHVWVRLFGANDNPDEATTKAIIAACRARGIAVAGWGWCKGHDPVADARKSIRFCDRYGLDAFVADIEDLGEGPEQIALANWNEGRSRSYFETMANEAGARIAVALSSNGFPSTPRRQGIIKGAGRLVQIVAPQIYWFNHPSQSIINQAKAILGPLSGTPQDNLFFTHICIDSWRHFTSVPLLVTGQAYWDAGETTTFRRVNAETKLSTFLQRFNRWVDIVGLNWWHLGHGALASLNDATGAMSPAMASMITAANLHQKPYNVPSVGPQMATGRFYHRELALVSDRSQDRSSIYHAGDEVSYAPGYSAGQATSQGAVAFAAGPESASFTQLAGVPVHYDREPLAVYGSDGVTHTFTCQPALKTALNALVTDLIAKSPAAFGALRLILSAGAFVNKPGQHGQGLAFDLDGLRWMNTGFTAMEQPTKTALYLGVQALCLKQFGQVLDFNYNVDHHDHLHIDLGRPIGFDSTKKSITLFIQSALNTLFGLHLSVDGGFGAQSEAALNSTLGSLGIGQLSSLANWLAFLDKVSAVAFAKVAATLSQVGPHSAIQLVARNDVRSFDTTSHLPPMVPAHGWVFFVQRLPRADRPAGFKHRTVGRYQVYRDGSAVPGLSGMTIEPRGPGDNSEDPGKSEGRCIEARTYPISTHATSNYRTSGYRTDGDHPMPGIGIDDTSARSGILIHPASGFGSTIGCFNLAGPLTNADAGFGFRDSCNRVIAVIDDLKSFNGGHLPGDAPVANAHLVVLEPADEQMVSPSMRLGSHGAAVTRWQSFLNGQNISVGAADGHFGHATEDGTKTFQARYGLMAEGIVGHDTLVQAANFGFVMTGGSQSAVAHAAAAQLGVVHASDVAVPVLKVGSSGPWVKAWQAFLVSQGFSVGMTGADGSFGQGTKAATKAFQSSNGLPADGVFGAATFAKASALGFVAPTGDHVSGSAQPQADVFAFASSWEGLDHDVRHPNKPPIPDDDLNDNADQAPFARLVIDKLLADNVGRRVMIGFDINVFNADAPERGAFVELARSVTDDHHQLRSIYLEGPFGRTAGVWDPGEARRFVKAAADGGLSVSSELMHSHNPSTVTGFNALRVLWYKGAWWTHTLNQLIEHKDAGYAAAEIDNMDTIFDDVEDAHGHSHVNPNLGSFELPAYGPLKGRLAFFRRYADEFVAGHVPKLILKNLDAGILDQIFDHRLQQAGDDRTKLPRAMFADFHICEIDPGTSGSTTNGKTATASAKFGIQTVFSEYTKHYRAWGHFNAHAGLTDVIGAPVPPSSLVANTGATMTGAQRADALPSGLRAAKDELSRHFLAATRRENAGAISARAATTDPLWNVVGVGIGEKESDGALSGIMSVKLLVQKKFAEGSVPSQHMLPKEINGYLVDIEEVGIVKPLANRLNPRGRFRPARPGCSIGFAFPPGDGRIMAGTFGTVVRDSQGRLCILSNNHVLADEGRLQPGAAIYQPGELDQSGGVPPDLIATLSEFAAFAVSPAFNTIDAALAVVQQEGLVAPEILHIGRPQGHKRATVDTKVHKVGRTTGYTVGSIISTATDITVAYDTGSFRFQDQILIVGSGGRTFSAGGDSGSLILDRADNSAVGLLFAGSDTHTFANHIGDVLARFGATMV
jgi:peptidoglycan hydrolase-like protein with peptidoglycan-binding domain